MLFIPLVSGLWSSDLATWVNVVRIKLPLLFLPLAVAGRWTFTQKQWAWLVTIFLAAVFGGSVWGLVDYAQHATQLHESYLRAKTIRTPLEDDHVRFSWLAAVAVILCLLLTQIHRLLRTKILLLLLSLFFVVYLHVLSARTGLLSLYLFLVLFAGSLLLKKQRRGRSLAVAAALIALPLLAYFFLPTFRARLRYNLYDLSFVQKQEYLPGSSDGARAASLKAGWQVLRQNPFGAGAGDVMHEADKWYAAHLPQVLPSDKLYPSSEWLVYGAFAGWPGVLLFSAVMLLPFFVRTKQRIFWIGFHATAAASFLFDVGLEVQYGVFLYAFLACFWWKWAGEYKQRSAMSNWQ